MRRARDGDHVGKKEQLEIAYRRIRQMTNVKYITVQQYIIYYFLGVQIIFSVQKAYYVNRNGILNITFIEFWT